MTTVSIQYYHGMAAHVCALYMINNAVCLYLKSMKGIPCHSTSYILFKLNSHRSNQAINCYILNLHTYCSKSYFTDSTVWCE